MRSGEGDPSSVRVAVFRFPEFRVLVNPCVPDRSAVRPHGGLSICRNSRTPAAGQRIARFGQRPCAGFSSARCWPCPSELLRPSLAVLNRVTEAFGTKPWLLWLLPLLGAVTAYVYRRWGGPARQGMTLILDEVTAPKQPIPLRMTFLSAWGTLMTLLGGGSAGIEATGVEHGRRPGRSHRTQAESDPGGETHSAYGGRSRPGSGRSSARPWRVPSSPSRSCAKAHPVTPCRSPPSSAPCSPNG